MAGFIRPTNNAGGLEAGITNGNPGLRRDEADYTLGSPSIQ